jgi:hypothetical protein
MNLKKKLQKNETQKYKCPKNQLKASHSQMTLFKVNSGWVNCVRFVFIFHMTRGKIL